MIERIFKTKYWAYGLIFLSFSFVSLAENQSHSIYEVISRGDIAALRILLKKDINPDTPAADFEGKTPAMYAVTAPKISSPDRIALLQLLVAKGANLNASTRFNETVLAQAVRMEEPAMLAWLIKHGANVNQLTSFRSPSNSGLEGTYLANVSLVMWCAAIDNADCLNLALQHNGDPHLQNGHGEDALDLALLNGKETAVLTILKSPNINKSDLRAMLNNRGYLVTAAELGSIESTDNLLKAGADPNAVDAENIKPLDAALHATGLDKQYRAAYLKIVNLLLDAGAQINLSSTRQSTLTLAIQTHDPAFVKALLARLPNNILEGNDWFLRYAINITDAIPADVIDIVELLIGHGSNKKGLGINKQNMLSLAVHNNPYLVPLIMDWGLDINQRDKTGSTPLIYAADNAEEAIDIIPLLINRGAQVNAQNERGWSALMYATRRGSVSAVKILLDAGANVNLASTDGITALSLAQAAFPPFRMDEIILLLQRAVQSS